MDEENNSLPKEISLAFSIEDLQKSGEDAGEISDSEKIPETIDFNANISLLGNDAEKNQEAFSSFSPGEVSASELSDLPAAENDLVAEITGKLSHSSEILKTLGNIIVSPPPPSDGPMEMSGDEEKIDSEPLFKVTELSNLPEKEKGPSLQPLENIKVFSETVGQTFDYMGGQMGGQLGGKSGFLVSASFPFSLLIEGDLKPFEKEKLVDLITQNEIGIREIDLEIQFQSGRILIPRISEYAGVMIVQALRASSTEMTFAPSDQAAEWSQASNLNFKNDKLRLITVEESQAVKQGPNERKIHPAEALPISTGFQLPQYSEYHILDVLTATALLKASAVEAENSQEYIETVESLKKEIIFKAFRKKADGIVNFSVQVIPLIFPTEFRILVMGSAVKAVQTNESDHQGRV